MVAAAIGAPIVLGVLIYLGFLIVKKLRGQKGE